MKFVEGTMNAKQMNRLMRLARVAVKNEIARANREDDLYDEQRAMNDINEVTECNEFSYEEALDAVQEIQSELDV